VIEAALILETGQRSRFQRIVVVTAPTDVQVARLAQARGLTEAEARQRLTAQWPNADKARLADDVIDNGGDPAATEQQVSGCTRRWWPVPWDR
jgi:dephospho-CoA kinase